MPLRARHQEKAVHSVVLYAARRKHARDSPLRHGCARLFDFCLCRGMHLGEPADQLRLAIRSGPALFEIREVLEEVSKQVRVPASFVLNPGRLTLEFCVDGPMSQLALESTRMIDIDEFVDIADIDPRYYTSLLPPPRR